MSTIVDTAPVEALSMPFNAGNSMGDITLRVPDVPSPCWPEKLVPQPNTVPSPFIA